MNTQATRQLAELILQSNNTVFFGGAGVSTESGIPDFRSDQGLYKEKSRIPPEEIISHSFFIRNPEMFYDFYKHKMVYPGAKPNPAHLALARLEAMGKMQAVITQNIDGLHQAAGSKNVLELHGSVHRNYCMRCRKSFTLHEVLKAPGAPACACGGMVKPDVVLYEEALDSAITGRAIRAIEKSELLIIGGTSLTVYPAASFVSLCSGKIAIINKSATMMDQAADVLITMPIGEAFAEVMEVIEGD
ncbi:MAG: NAD-dependent protein deacylase [Christensenellales bacterium]|jgi:NAD-dependent deacetylase